MNLIYYNDIIDIQSSDATGPVKRFFKDLARQPQLFAMVRNTMAKVKNSDDLNDLNDLINQGWVSRLANCDYPIYEFRIPPQRRQGVVRLYFAYKKSSLNTIIILSAEIKSRREANTEKLNKQKRGIRRFAYDILKIPGISQKRSFRAN